MQKHTSVYFSHFDYTGQEFIPCECCGAKAVDINHIICKGMGGVKNNRLDIIENLMAVCRKCHDKYGDNKNWLEYLVEKHAIKLGVKFDALMETIKSL